MKRIKTLILLSFVLLCGSLSGQSTKLAQQYYNTGEYEKAAEIYYKMYETNKQNSYYFNKYIECLKALEKFDKLKSEIKQQLKIKPEEAQLYITLGSIYEQQDQQIQAEKNYQKAINNLPDRPHLVSRIANTFIQNTKYDLALKVYENASKMEGFEHAYSSQMADLYRRKGDIPLMIKSFIKMLDNENLNIKTLQNSLQRYLNPDDYTELKSQLFQNIQSVPENNLFPELLQWAYMQDKEYDKALRQARALDRKLDENGQRVFDLGSNAYNDKDYGTAIKAFEYIVQQKGASSSYYFDAKTQLLKAKKQNVIKEVNYSKAKLDSLSIDYDKFLNEFGYNNQTAWIAIDHARLNSEFLDNNAKAIIILNKLIAQKSIKHYTIANAKLLLGDYYLIDGNIWEGSLLFSQVDKDFKEQFLGEKARYKNAMLSYFNGDFEWSQTQFDILKAATSKLISNDAIDMSVFIMDNMNLDTTSVPLQLFANAELLMLQNKYEMAFSKLDSVKMLYMDHSLLDDIAYRKAQIFVKQRAFDKAQYQYEYIITNHPEEIRCDNSIFELAEMLEIYLDDSNKAMEWYEKLYLEYSNSTLALEARKKFRLLRGDNIQ